jgi:hypothetical protein
MNIILNRISRTSLDGAIQSLQAEQEHTLMESSSKEGFCPIIIVPPCFLQLNPQTWRTAVTLLEHVHLKSSEQRYFIHCTI